MKNLLKLHIKFLLAMLMTFTMLMMLPACSSTSGGTAEDSGGSTPEYGKECYDACAADCTNNDCIEACTQTCFP